MHEEERMILDFMAFVLKQHNTSESAYEFESISARLQKDMTPLGKNKTSKLTSRSSIVWTKTAGTLLACLQIALRSTQEQAIHEILERYDALWPNNRTPVLQQRKCLIDQLIDWFVAESCPSTQERTQ